MTDQQQSLLDVDPAARRVDDFYPTPGWMTLGLQAHCPGLFDRGRTRIVEPCVGDGAIVRMLPAGLEVVTNDIVARPPVTPDYLLDARRSRLWETIRRDRGAIAGVVTNPPFESAFDIVRCAVDAVEMTGFVAMLLRLSWLEPTDDRGPWLEEHPPRRVVVMPRHDFRGNGSTDSVTSAWMVWSYVDVVAPGVVVLTKRQRQRLIAEERRYA